ncbi:hypothetical protein HDV05_005957, partial [Chytridiales sp. JEL 0842]
MGPLTDFPDLSKILEGVRHLLAERGQDKVLVEPIEAIDHPGLESDGGSNGLLKVGTGVVGGWGDRVATSSPSQAAAAGSSSMSSTKSGAWNNFGFGGVVPTSNGDMDVDDGAFVLPPALDSGDDDMSHPEGTPNSHTALSEMSDDDSGIDEQPLDPTFFLYAVLRTCLEGFQALPSSVVKGTRAVVEAKAALKMGLEYVKVLDGGLAESIVSQTRHSTKTLHTASINLRAPPTSGSSSSSRKQKQTDEVVDARASNLPAEVLLRVFGFLTEPEPGAPLPASSLRECASVCKSWHSPASTQLWKRLSMDDDLPRLSRLVLCLTTSQASSQRQPPQTKPLSPPKASLVRVISISCSDADLALLITLSSHLTSLHSLELRRSTLPNSTSYRLLDRLPGRFPSLRSLFADTIPPSALENCMEIVRTTPELQSLHISLSAPSLHSTPTLPLNPNTLSTLFAHLPNLKTLSLWRVPLPRDAGLWVPSLASSCPNLKAVRIDDCGDISMDVFVDLWRRCEGLECLVFRKLKRRAAFTDLLLRPTMTRVVLDACWVNDALLESVGVCAPNLEVFYVEDDWADDDFRHPEAPTVVGELTEKGVEALARHLRGLRTMTFIGFPGRRNFGAPALRALLDANPQCTALNLARMHPLWPHAISDTFLLDLAPSLGRIEVLELYIQNRISEQALIQTLTIASSISCPPSSSSTSPLNTRNPTSGGRLLRLGLSGCNQIGDSTLKTLPHLFPRLERLDMKGSRVTSSALQSLVSTCKNLKECCVDLEDVEGMEEVEWGKVVQRDDPVSEEVFSPYSVWE